MDDDNQLGQLFEESSDPAFIVDPFGDQILAANRAGCALLGYTRQELLATPVSRIHPADLPQLREFFNRVLEHRQGSTIKLTCRTKPGTFLPIAIALFSFGSGGHLRILVLLQVRSDDRQPTAGDSTAPGTRVRHLTAPPPERP